MCMSGLSETAQFIEHWWLKQLVPGFNPGFDSFEKITTLIMHNICLFLF